MSKQASLTLENPFRPVYNPMPSPSQIDRVQIPDLLAQLNAIREQYYELLDAETKTYIATLCPYRRGTVLQVDTSFAKRRKMFAAIRGSSRFLVLSIRPSYWHDQHGRFTGIHFVLMGFFLHENGDVIEGENASYDIALNTSGDTATILGLAANTHHNFNFDGIK